MRRREIKSLTQHTAAPDTAEIEDASSANSVVRKIVEARAYARHVKKWAEAELRRAEREEQFFIRTYGHQLEVWIRAELAKDRRSKCIRLPAGILGYRIEPKKLELKDDEKLMAWCRRSLPNALVVRTLIVRDVLTRYIQKTGKCPDGAAITGGRQQFHIASKKSLHRSRSAR
jgi:hypothetical protein